jgi:LacI family transcriptional regulator
MLDPEATEGTIEAVYNVGPCSFGVARALAEHGYGHEVMFVAHDLLEVHRSMLLSGAMSYLLHQDVEYAVTAASRVLRALCDGVRGALAINNPRIEILTAENLA